LNAVRSCVGRLLMNPTVSDRMAEPPEGRKTERIVVSSVANSLSSDPTLLPVNQ
jgi:hypothetical protein